MLRFLPAFFEILGIAAAVMLILFGGRWLFRRFVYGPSLDSTPFLPPTMPTNDSNKKDS